MRTQQRKHQYQGITLATAVVIIIGLPIGLFFLHTSSSSSNMATSTDNLFALATTSASTPSVSASNVASTPVSPGMNQYDASIYGVAFSYPSTLTLNTYSEGDGNIFAFEEASKGVVVQIYVTAYSGTTLTYADIQKDIPDLNVADPTTVAIGAHQDHKALSFTDGDTSPETREVWFVYNGNLFQMTYFTDEETTAASIVNSFQFNP